MDPKGLLAAVQQEKTVVRNNSNEVNPTRELYNQVMSQEEMHGSSPGSTSVDPAVIENVMAQDMEMFRFQDRAARVDSLLALQQLAQALKGIPGRKTLLWVGSGIKFLDSTLLTREIIPRGAGESLDQNAYTWKLLNDANVAVYPIDTRRTVNSAFDPISVVNANTPSSVAKEDARQTDREIVATFENIAAETGGKPCVYRTDLHNCIREATEDNRDYYLLGFYVDKNNRKPGWHKINVKLDQKATLRYRQGFLVTQNNPEATRSLDLQLALNSPIDYTDLSFRGQFTGFKEKGTKKAASFELGIPPDAISVDETNSKINFDVVAVVRAVGGAEAARISQHIDRKFPPENIAEIKRTGIDYRNKIDLAPGEYGVWFVVRDNPTGRTGSIAIPLKVP
jgi:VWFA-related protein